MPRVTEYHGLGRGACFRSIATLFVGLTLASLAVSSPARAFEFILISGSSDQHLNWYWETAYPAKSCQSNPTPCGDIASVNGMFSSSFQSITNPGSGSNQVTLSGGELSWVGSDSLKVTATARIRARVAGAGIFPSIGNAESWDALNVRDFPLSFLMQAEPGDPPTTNLKITPTLAGHFDHVTAPGGTSEVFLQMLVDVKVNGLSVTGDTLFTQWSFDNGAGGTRTVEFPRGAVNTVMVPAVPANSFITITIWSYTRVRVTNPAIVFVVTEVLGSTSPGVGQGPVISVLAQPLGVTGVEPDVAATMDVSLAASPNPTPSGARIAYTLPRAAEVRLSIYDVAGQRVATLVDGFHLAGRREVAWNGRTSSGHVSSPGVYLIELVAGGERRVGKLVVAR